MATKSSADGDRVRRDARGEKFLRSGGTKSPRAQESGRGRRRTRRRPRAGATRCVETTSRDLDHLRQKAARAAEVRAAESEPAAKRARNTKPWVPGYRTAAFALLVTAHRLALEGREVLTKDELQDETEVSGLSAKGIKPKPTSRAVVGGRGAAQHYAYCGWNSFKSLKTLQNGYVEPMVNTWKKSYAMQIRLSKTGTELAAKLHAAAEARGDCSCGFAAPGENVNPQLCPRIAKKTTTTTTTWRSWTTPEFGHQCVRNLCHRRRKYRV